MRSFGTPISRNIRSKGYLKPETRGVILGLLKAGKSTRAVAREIGVSSSTVTRTRQRWNIHATNDPLPKPGRPEIFTLAEKKYIRLLARRSPRIAWKTLVAELGNRACKDTVRRVLRGL